MNNYTQRQLETELSKLVIDLVWSATDGGCKLKESDFSHFEEPLYEWTELVNKFSASIAQAEQEMLKRVAGEIEKRRKEVYHFPSSYSETLEYKEDVGYNQALDDLLSSLDPKSFEKAEEIINKK